jgi:hypothetical protein
MILWGQLIFKYAHSGARINAWNFLTAEDAKIFAKKRKVFKISSFALSAVP